MKNWVWVCIPILLSGCNSFKSAKLDSGSAASELDKACSTADAVSPVYSGVRRLSLNEIRNSVRDLLGVNNSLNTILPPDSKQGFYNNNGNALKVSYVFLESLFDASESILDAAFANTAARNQILICQNQNEVCARQILEKLARKAFHKAVNAAMIDRLITVFKKGATLNINFEESLKLAIRSLIASPDFVYVAVNPKGTDLDAVKDLDDFEIASRLSLFLWSSVPDDELINLASAGTLKANLDAQVIRMLKSPKAETLIDEFAANWLALENLAGSNPDATLFPMFTAELRADMLTETKLLIREILINDANPIDFITGNYSFLNERLANHYGMSGVTGAQFRKVDISALPRRGVLGHASILTLTSANRDTSIVRRGKYIMDRLLCQTPPPPPENIPLEPAQPGSNLSQRERLEQHRADPACIGCHSYMDPMGFLLENFSPVGTYRTTINGQSVDSRADFPDGKIFFSPVEMTNDLAKGPVFKQCLSRELLNFALGRQFTTSESCHSREIASVGFDGNKKFSDLVKALVKGMAFQKEGAQK